MSAKNNDDARVRELYRVILETEQRVKLWNMDKAQFLANDTLENRSVADSLLMCVFRATEEAGNMSQTTREAYPQIEWNGIHTMRNVLAHDYGAADREIIWASIEKDFPGLKAFCEAYAEDNGIELVTL